MSTRAARRAQNALEGGARPACVLGGVEKVRVDAERDVRRRVPELPRHEDDVEPFRDQERRVGVPQVVEAQLPEPGRLQRLVEPAP
jgi:hypothetical protein